jgi:hypothetical protein
VISCSPLTTSGKARTGARGRGRERKSCHDALRDAAGCPPTPTTHEPRLHLISKGLLRTALPGLAFPSLPLVAISGLNYYQDARYIN